MRLPALAAWLVLAALAAPEARAEIVVGDGTAAATANGDARCTPTGGPVDGDQNGDPTAPWSASASVHVQVPCDHGGGAHAHTASGSSSVTASVSTGQTGTIINASGTAGATVVHEHVADASAEFEINFGVTDTAVDYRLTTSGSVMMNGGLVTSQSGTMEPGFRTIRGFAQCSANANGNCAGNGFSFTLELGVPEDTDGDALFDVWETDGIDTDGDDVPELDLPAMGADPQHKDVFLEIDAMPGHALSQTAVDRVVAAFAAAPVGNPDGDDGIVLHVDNGPTSRMDPTTGAAWGGQSDADEVAHDTVLGGVAAGNYDWSEFDAVKAANFLPERANAFHYLVSAHRYGSPTNSSSGISRDITASDLIVSLGAEPEPAESSGTPQEQAGTIMHELGHNLGLTHGGDDLFGNYEPNRLSIMNYAFQFTGIPRADGTDVLDYQRLAVDLDERALDENVGFGLPATGEPAQWLTIYRCPDRSRRWAFLQASLTDWNCDGTEAGVFARDLNGDGVPTALVPFLDWPALVFHGGAIGGAGAALPDVTEMIEPPVEELRENAALVEQAHREAAAGPRLRAGGGGPSGGGPGGTIAADLPPMLSGLALSPSTFAPARRGASTGRRGPARLRFRASRSGFVRFTVVRELPGRRAGRRCVAARRGTGRRCTRLARVRGSFTLAASAGANGTRFTGRLRRRALTTGRYRLVATPLSARDRRAGKAGQVRFRIVRHR